MKGLTKPILTDEVYQELLDTCKENGINPTPMTRTVIHRHPKFKSEVLARLKKVTHMSNSDFDFPKIMNVDDLDAVFEDFKIIKGFMEINQISTPVTLSGPIQWQTYLSRYVSDLLTMRHKSQIQYQLSKSYISKYKDQRIANEGEDKIVDNFRYAICRAYGLAYSNQFPLGGCLNEQAAFKAYDRSNLTEFCVVNLIDKLNPSDSNVIELDDTIKSLQIQKHKITKTQALSVMNDIKDVFKNTYPPELDDKINKIGLDDVTSTYTLGELIGVDGIDAILYKMEQFHILIGHTEVISQEIISLNNRNNPWCNINFIYQKVYRDTGISLVDVAKKALSNNEYELVRNFNSSLIATAPEYCLMPVIVDDIIRASDFSTSKVVAEIEDTFVRMASILQGRGANDDDNSIGYIHSVYGNLKGEDLQLRTDSYRYDLIDSYYTVSCLDIFKKYKKRLADLKKVIQHQKKKNIDRAAIINMTQLDRLASDLYYNIYVQLALKFAGNGKTLKNSFENVENSIELYLETLFGAKIFTYDLSTNAFTIKDDLFNQLITHFDDGGMSQSHSGRASYVANPKKLKEYKEKYQDFEKYQGTNEQLIDKSIEELKNITGQTRFKFYELTTNGKVVVCGWDGDNKVGNVSLEHHVNTSHEITSIRALECNSADGSKPKAYDTTSPSGFWKYIIKQMDENDKVRRAYGNDADAGFAKYILNQIINHYDAK